MAFYWFVKRRAQFAEHLQKGGSGLSTGRYTRLMGMAVSEILISSGYGTYVYGMFSTPIPRSFTHTGVKSLRSVLRISVYGTTGLMSTGISLKSGSFPRT